jgi:hypothetical protein
MTKRTSLVCGGAICGAFTMIATLPFSAQTETVIYNFAAGKDGASPYVGLASYKARLYVTTINGGSTGNGQAYRLTRPKTGTTWTKSWCRV